jgi:ribosome modulation factor
MERKMIETAKALDRRTVNEAMQRGWDGFHDRAVCPYPHGLLGDAWRKGWEEAEDFYERAW